MMQWVIDEKPFNVLAEHCRASAPRFEPGMVTVVDELERRASVSSFFWRRDLLAARDGDGKRIIAVHPVMNDTPAFEYLFSELRPHAASADKDLVEHLSIAACAHDLTEAVFVAEDKGAAFLALSELGRGRVATPFDLWDDLLGRSVIALDDFKRLCVATERSMQPLRTPVRLRR